MEIRESELPGVGKKFECLTKKDEKLSVIIHDNGRRELYFFDEDDHESAVTSATFDDNESRQLAAIIGGMTYKPKALENMEIAFDDLVIEWSKVEMESIAAGKTIGNLEIRKKYGVSIIAILKGNHKKITKPGPDTYLEVNDTAVIAGDRADVKQMVQTIFCRKER